MNFRFGEWYVVPNSTDLQMSNYEVLAIPLSYLYIMMVAVNKGRLAPVSGGTEVITNVMEDLIIDKEPEGKPIDGKPVPNDDIEQAKEELESMIDRFHRSVLEYDDILAKKKNKLDEKRNM